MQNRQLLLNLIVTASLAFPGIAAGAFQQQMAQSERILSQNPIKLPEAFGEAKSIVSQLDINEPNLARRHYVTPSGIKVDVLCRQSSIFTQIHDFTDCLIANGYKPEFLCRVDTKTEAGALRGQIIATTHASKRLLTILWFQTGTRSGADRWEWRKTLLTEGVPKFPVCRELEITIRRSDNTQKDIQTLTEIAADLYRAEI